MTASTTSGVCRRSAIPFTNTFARCVSIPNRCAAGNRACRIRAAKCFPKTQRSHLHVKLRTGLIKHFWVRPRVGETTEPFVEPAVSHCVENRLLEVLGG